MKDLICTRDLDRLSIDRLFELARQIKHYGTIQDAPRDVLKGKRMITLFGENSTRTRSSFEIAMQMLGGDVVNLPIEKSSLFKNESLEDTFLVLDCYHPDVIVTRLPQEGVLEQIALKLQASVINAGDGCHDHPTQGLLDFFTIQEAGVNLERFTMAIIGDLKNSRVAHSHCYMARYFYDIQFVFISPPSLRLPRDYTFDLERNVPPTQYIGCNDIGGRLFDVDVAYVARLQKERDSNLTNEMIREYQLVCSSLSVNDKKPLIMHPGPVDQDIQEIHPDLRDDPRFLYWRQIENGLYIRMALLCHLLNS